jgi:hypothetical protein
MAGPQDGPPAAGDELAVQLEAAFAQASALAGGDERVVAVMPAEPGRGRRVYLIAYEGGGGLSYLALDGALEPLTDARLVREAVTMLALAERAEEASGATLAEELAGALAGARRELAAAGLDEAAAAARAAEEATAEVARVTTGPRLATPAYLDSVAAAASTLDGPLYEFRTHVEAISHRLSGSPGDALEPAARASWAVLAALGRGGDPGAFSNAMTSSTVAVEALVSDVVVRYRLPLEDG